MRMHLLEYTKENYVELEVELMTQLIQRRQSLQSYIKIMEWTPASGSELTLLILSRMFNISILVVRSDFLWASRNVAPMSCDVVLVQSCNFLGTKRVDGKVVEIGEVPKYIVNKKRSLELTTSTPNNRYGVGTYSEITQPDVSPIGEKVNMTVSDDSAFSLNQTLDSTVRLNNEIRQFEQGTLKEDGDNTEGEVKTSKKPLVKLHIKDIGNDTSSDFSPAVYRQSYGNVLTPNSTSPLNVTSPTDDNLSKVECAGSQGGRMEVKSEISDQHSAIDHSEETHRDESTADPDISHHYHGVDVSSKKEVESSQKKITEEEDSMSDDLAKKLLTQMKMTMSQKFLRSISVRLRRLPNR